jgi:hypothetical protein
MSLCTVAELKLHIGLTAATHDTLLAEFVDEASGVINSETRRQIEIADIIEYHDGEQQNAIILHEFPVAEEADFIVTEDGDVIADTDYAVDFQQGVLRLLDGATFALGEKNVKVEYRAGYDVTGSPPVGEAALPAELKLACKIIAGKLFQLREVIGVSQKRFRDGTTTYKEMIDEGVKSILMRHQRKIVG